MNANVESIDVGKSDSLLPGQREVLNAALGYAARGWRVLPVGKESKRPKNCNGSTGATTERDQILKWWQEHPSANVGIATGPASGLWVVDVDMKEGVNGWQSLIDSFGSRVDFDIEKHLAARTATGGAHFLFRWEEGLEVHNAQGILPGVDIRGHGGYIVAPPSARNIDGKWVQYIWKTEGTELSPVLPWAKELVSMERQKTSRPLDLTRIMSGLESGERDTQLWRYACHLAGRGVPMDLAISFITVAAERCNPPFDRNIAVQKVTRAYLDHAPASTLADMVDALERLKQGGRHEHH